MLIDLPEKLRKLREEHHYSQKMVASRLMCSPSIISSYETGERFPGLANLIALAYLYHVSTDYLLGKEDNCRDIDFSKFIDIDGLEEEQIKALQIIISAMLEGNREKKYTDSISNNIGNTEEDTNT